MEGPSEQVWLELQTKALSPSLKNPSERLLRQAGADEATIARLVPHKVFPGDRPSVTILLPRLDPFTLGALIALYEHKVFTLGAVWNINPFDQWGVELGKVLANPLVRELEAGARGEGHDGSTAGLLAEVLRLQAQA